MRSHDRDLGMTRDITRRDFLNGYRATKEIRLLVDLNARL